MKKTLLVLALLFSCEMLLAQHKTIKQTDPSGYTYEMVKNDPTKTRIYTLKNGLKVFLAQNKDEPRIQTFIPVRTGSNNDPEDNTGLAHYLEHMVFKGTSNMGTQDWEKEKVLIQQISDLYEQHKNEKNSEKKKEIYKQIDNVSQEASKLAVANEYDKMISSIGATGTNAHTWYDETVYKNNIPSNELEKWMIVESERFNELVLRLFHTELEAVYEEFNRSQDNDYRLVSYEFMKTMFDDNHYGTQTTIGTSEHLKNPSMEAIHKYFNEFYIANNMAVVLVGDFEFEPTIKLVDTYFGKMRTGPEPKRYVASQKKITRIKSAEVFSPSAERVQFGYRFGGVKSDDAKYVRVIDMILSNSTAGLIDLNINQKQKTQGAGSYAQILKDVGMHVFYGTPKEEQTLDEVKDLLIAEINKIKTGDFDDFMIQAVINDLKKSRIKQWESTNGLASSMYDSFINEQSWADVVNELDELSKITKQDLMAFANKHYKDNYVIIYKRTGENKNLVRVENPGITPIQLNRDASSQFFKDFNKLETKEIKPVFVDFNKAIQQEKIKNTTLSFIENTTNDISSLYYITDVGSDHDKKLNLAINYLDYLGTSTLTPENLKKEFYKLGIDYGVGAGNDRSYVYISGLQENLDAGIKLFEHLLSDAKANKQSYNDYVAKILKERKDNKTQKYGIQNALNQYVMYGKNSRFRDILSEEELKAIDPNELVKIVREFLNYDHQIFYYGNDLASTKKSILKHHHFGNGKTVPAPKEYPQPASNGNVYFAPYDMVQAEITFRARGDKFNKSLLTPAGIYNQYFGSGLSSIIFQEIRESKSLAYSAYSYFANASEVDKHNYLYAYVGTQANKLPQAVDALMTLMNDMPKAEAQFEGAKQSALKQIATQRYTKAGIFFYWLRLKKQGFDYDINKEIYNETKKITLDDLNTFFNQRVKGKKFNVGLLGKKENLDWEAVKQLGSIQELSLEELFGY